MNDTNRRLFVTLIGLLLITTLTGCGVPFVPLI